MPFIVLERTDIALFTDPEGTRVIIPRLQSQNRTRSYHQALPIFEGDEYATPFRGTGRARSLSMTARYLADEHGDAADLIDLFDLAHDSVDPRLLLRPHVGLDPRLNAIEVVVVSEVPDTPSAGGIWDISFTADRVSFTVEV